MVDKAKDEIILNQLVENVRTLREVVNYGMGMAFGPDRDMYQVLGYPEHVSFEMYYGKYKRQDIAKRIVNSYPDATWVRPPTITDNMDEDNTEESKLQEDFDKLAQSTRLFQYLTRVDRLSGIGNYGVLLIGVRDGRPLNRPVGRVRGPEDIIYMMPFTQAQATIDTYETDISNERYGLPKIYKIKTGGYGGGEPEAGGVSNKMPEKTILVHYTRIIHVAEGLSENEVFGTPRMEATFNRLNDLEKVIGGSAELYWLNGRGGLNLNADKEGTIRNPEDVKQQVDDYVNKLTRVIRTQGMDVRTLEFQIFPPDKHVNSLLDLIGGATGIPKRILVGSERGELASQQDEGNWLSRVAERRDVYCEPMLLRPIINRFMEWGALSQVDEYRVLWPDLASNTDRDKADIASKVAAAIATYVNAMGGTSLIPPRQFVEKVLQMPYLEEEVEEIMKMEKEEMEADAAAEQEFQQEVGREPQMDKQGES